MKLFDDTIKMNAHFYLTSDGDETTRDDLLREMRDGYPIYMVYLGGGYVPLKLAVEAFTGEHETWEAAQEWARKADRLDEIGEDVECQRCDPSKESHDGKWVAKLPQMYWTVNKNDEDVHIWVCPECLWECPQPESYGEVELVIQQVPKSILEKAWVLERPLQSNRVGIWPAPAKHLDMDFPIKWVGIDDLVDILSEDQISDLRSVYEVVTDNPKIGELIIGRVQCDPGDPENLE
jgi:hypothetical protein